MGRLSGALPRTRLLRETGRRDADNMQDEDFVEDGFVEQVEDEPVTEESQPEPDEEDNGFAEPFERRLSMALGRIKRLESALRVVKRGGSPGSEPATQAEADELRDFASLRSRGYSPEEIEVAIRPYARGASIALSKAAEHPFVANGIAAMRSAGRSTVSEEVPPAPKDHRGAHIAALEAARKRRSV